MAQDERRKSKIVMCVDDSPVIRALIVRTVSSAGYRIVACANGEECLQQLPAVLPQIILLDVEMPGIGGFETLVEIRKRFPELEARVIMLTASRTREAVDQARNGGANDFIIKPMDPDRLIERIDYWAGLRTF